MDPNRKQLLDQLTAILGADEPDGEPDPELAKLTDEELLRRYQTELDGSAAAERQRDAAMRADPVFGYLHGLTDDELIAEYERAQAELVAAETERERRAPRPEPASLPVPPTEIHPVVIPEPETPAPKSTPRLTPQQERDRRENAAMLEAVAAEQRAAELRARLDHERRDVGTYDGPMLGEMLNE